MLIFLLLLPFISAAIGGLSAYFSLYLLMRPQKIPQEHLIETLVDFTDKHFDIEAIVRQTIEEIDLKGEMEGLLDKHLNDLVLIFKKQIPMGGLFLTESLTGRLKTQTKDEIVKMLPELKNKVAGRLLSNFDQREFFKKKLQVWSTLLFQEIAGKVFKQEIGRLSLCGALLGFIIGLIILIIGYLFLFLGI